MDDALIVGICVEPVLVSVWIVANDILTIPIGIIKTESVVIIVTANGTICKHANLAIMPVVFYERLI